MRLTYETGTATLIQFIVLSFLNIANAADSIVSTCSHSGGDCVGNLLTSVIFYILIVFWFGFIAFVGFMAQKSRSSRISKLLIACELSILAVAAYNIKLDLSYHNGALAPFTSLIDIILAVWVISLAYRLTKAKGRRVVKKSNITGSKTE